MNQVRVFTVDGEEYPYKVAFDDLVQLSNSPKDSNMKNCWRIFAPGFFGRLGNL